jgi:hypothetical protein
VFKSLAITGNDRGKRTVDIADLTRAPREASVAGVKRLVRSLKMGEWGQLHAWLKDHAEDPFTRAVRQVARTRAAEAPITQEQEDYLLSEGRKEAEHWPPRASSPAWFDILGNTEGGDLEFLKAVLRTITPDVTDEEAREIGEGMSEKESSRLILIAIGRDSDPKAGTPLPSPPTTKKRRDARTVTIGRRSSTG